MKNLMMIIAAAFSVGAVAATQGSVSPDQYECRGESATVSYTTTSFIGKPTFRVEIKGEEARLPAFPEIKHEDSVLGDLVTVTDNHLVPVDGPSIHYTLILPNVVLKDGQDKAEFSTMLVKTSDMNPFFRPVPFTGATKANTFVEVQCKAEHVIF